MMDESQHRYNILIRDGNLCHFLLRFYYIPHDIKIAHFMKTTD